jgi:hypothetical protein
MIIKRFFIVTALIILTAFKKDSIEKTYLYDEGAVTILNGHVKQIIDSYERHIGVAVSDTLNFNIKGHQADFSTGNPLNRYKIKYVHKYDNVGRIMQTVNTASGSTGFYEYNKNGYNINLIFDPKSNGSESNLFKYDKAGYLIEQDHFIKPKLLADIIKYTYDRNHHLIKTEQRSRKGSIEFRETFSYKFDFKGNWTKATTLSEGFYSTPTDIQTHVSSRRIVYY